MDVAEAAAIPVLWYRRNLFGPHGRKVVAFLCGWECVALVPGSPVPTLSEIVNRHWWVGVAIMAALGHHWFVEQVVQELRS